MVWSFSVLSLRVWSYALYLEASMNQRSCKEGLRPIEAKSMALGRMNCCGRHLAQHGEVGSVFCDTQNPKP